MRSWTFLLAAGTAVILCGAWLATAAPNVGQIPSLPQGSPGLIRNSALVGTMVLYPQGQDLGRIKEVLFDSQTGQATFVILDPVVPVAGHAMLVVPYQALQVSSNPPDNRLSIVLGLRPDRLAAAPQIRNDQWQMIQNPQFLNRPATSIRSRRITPRVRLTTRMRRACRPPCPRPPHPTVRGPRGQLV